jgi:putative CocE/NonD family hydrolase
MDAGTADGVLARYNSAPRTPMQVWITANSHTGQHGSDPFFPDDPAPTPSFDAQWASMSAFLEQVARGERIQRQIHYYVLGARSFRTTDVWPPRDTTRTNFYFAPESALDRTPSDEPSARDRYEVDFSVSTGEATRWTTQIGAPAAYGDRRATGLLSYTSAPFTQDIELVGQPTVRLFVSSQTADPAFFVYLEDVAPDGRVTYLTEGLFRAIHRRETTRGRPYAQAAPAHSFARRDARPMPVGEIEEVAFATFPVAALLRAGHRLRVSIAGADASAFRRYSEGRADAFELERSAARPSHITVDLRPWSAQ